MKAIKDSGPETTAWFDPFTRWMLIIMIAILTLIFVAAKFMDMHSMAGGGTDDTVNAIASQAARVKAHPFINLPGDTQVGAFSIANFFAGLIVGHNWQKIFGRKKEN